MEQHTMMWGVLIGLLFAIFYLFRRAWRDSRPESDDLIRRIFREVDEEN